MFFFGSPRIGLKALAALCRRLAMSLSAGVDVRTVWAREREHAHGIARSRYRGVSEAIDMGSSMSEALATAGSYFPEFFRELVKVGEESGHLPEVFRRLAEHYEQQIRMRRNFFSAITWPMLELFLALGVVGLLIWLMGAVPALRNNNTDLLGFGLVGNDGLVTYLAILAGIGAGIFLLYRAAARGALWVGPVQRVLMAIPQLGRAIEVLALARLTWAMHVTLNSGMNLRPALTLSLRSTQNVVYTQTIDEVVAAVGAGNEIHEALGGTGVFPIDFLDAVRVGEESGQLVESMANLSEQYQERARIAITTITILMGVAVSALVAGVIIFLIFRVFSFYTGALNDALNMRP